MKITPRPGRPSKYTPQVVKTICAAIEKGLAYKHAVALAGISQDTFCEWQRQYPEFSEAIQRSLAEGIAARLALIIRAAKTDWRAAAWWLEHVCPEEFAKNRVDVIHKGQISQNFVVPPALLQAIAAARNKHERPGSN